MKILLTTLNSKYIHSNLALRYLYGASGAMRENIEVREFTINNPRDYIFAEIVRGKYDIVAFSCYIWNIDKTKSLIRDLKAAMPQTVFVVGGPEVSFECEQFMDANAAVSILMSGEGESVIEDVLKQALSSPDQRRIVRSQPADLGTVGFPYEYYEPEPDKVLYYESSRGCPYRCSYCLSSVSGGLRYLPIERTRSELQFFLDRNVRQVKFIDRTFNADRARCASLLNFIADNDNGVTNFHFEICGDLIDDALIDAVKRSRKDLFRFEVGIQSTNAKSLEACGRASDFALLSSNVRRLISTGKTCVHADLIAGLPYEDYGSFRQSFNDVFSLGADELQLGFLKLLKGSLIREQADRYGYVFSSEAPYEVISNDFISAADIVRLKMIENVFDLLYNRKGFSRTLSYELSLPGMTPFSFFEMFAEFFYDRGYQNRSHKKEDVYRFLYAFSCTQGDGETVKKLLSLDMEDTLNFDAVKKFVKKGWQLPDFKQENPTFKVRVGNDLMSVSY